MPDPSEIRVGVIRIEGTNCEDESAAAFSSLGCDVEKVHLKQLLEDYSASGRLSDYYFWYGVMLYEMEKSHLQTVMAMRQVDSGSERDDDRWFLLGKVNHDQKKWNSAVLAFAKLKKLHPNSRFLEEGLYLQAQSFYKQKQYNSGLETLNELQSTFNPL